MSSHPEYRIARLTGLLVLFALLGACRADDVTSPAAHNAIVPVPVPIPMYVIDYFRDQTAGVDAVVRAAWNECAASGTIGMDTTAYTAGVNCRLIPVNEYLRRFIVYIPPTLQYGPDNPAAVVVMHHGSSGTGEQFLNISGWKEEADEEGFIAVFPTGAVYHVLDTGRLNTKWNDYGLVDDVDLSILPPGYPATAPWPADDILFENRILDDISAMLPIDTARIFAAGFSNGAGFTSRLSVELSDRFAATGAVAGALQEEYLPVRRIPTIWAVGNEDDRVLELINAQLVTQGRDTLIALPLDPDSLLDLPALPDVIGSINLTFDLDPAVYTTYTDSAYTVLRFASPLAGNTDGNVVVFGVLAGVTHQFPRGPRGTRNGNNPLGFDAAHTFWAFFERRVP